MNNVLSTSGEMSANFSGGALTIACKLKLLNNLIDS